MNSREYELMLLASRKAVADAAPPHPRSAGAFDMLDLMAVAAGTASPELAGRVESYLEQHPESEVARLLATYKEFAAGEPIRDTPPDDSLLERIKVEGFAPVPSRSKWRLPLALVAILTAVLIGGTALVALWPMEKQPDQTPEPIPPGATTDTTSAPVLAKLSLENARDVLLPNQAKEGATARFVATKPLEEHALEFRVRTQRSRGVMYHVGSHGISQIGVVDRDKGGAVAGTCRMRFGDRGDSGVILVLVDADAKGADLAESLGSFLDDQERAKLIEAVGRPGAEETARQVIPAALARVGFASPLDVRLVATVHSTSP